jgi:diguanylate cyclase (GGDEF)-like protein/PAS domain S-box-containing protein
MSKQRLRLLIVEDDSVDRLACRRALAQHPLFEFEFLEAETGREGLQLAATHHPDCVLLDHHLPDFTGLEFLAELAGKAGATPVPVIMLTGADNVGIAVEAMRRGARDYLVKDVERLYLELLPTIIERVLGEREMREQKVLAEAKYRTLVEQIPAITYIADLATPGKLLYISPQMAILGFAPEACLAEIGFVRNRIHPEDRPQAVEQFDAMRSSGQPQRCEYRLQGCGGAYRWFLDEAAVVKDEHGQALFLQGILVDITEDKHLLEELEQHRRRLEDLVAQRTALLDKRTVLLEEANTKLVNELGERKRVELALRDSEARFRLLLESAGEGIYGIDAKGCCTFINDAALTMLGYDREQVLGLPVHDLLHSCGPKGAPLLAEECPLCAALQGGEASRGVVELVLRKDREAFPAEFSTQPIRERDQIVGAVVVFHDVTEAQAMNQQLFYQATHDGLTSLVNRNEFEWRLARVLESARADRSEHALCYLDLDQFKVVNDSCGHAAGDELLRQISGVLQKKLRDRDTLARLGGDEFGVLLEHCPMDQARRIAADLLEAVRDFHFHWLDKSFTVGVSIGVAPLTEATESAADALSAADAACYLAKEKGRNRVHVYEPTEVESLERHAQMQWVERINQALNEDRFHLCYQPITPLAANPTGRMHYEILLRMRDEDGQLILPGAFLPTAERYHMLAAIDRWVVRHVIASCAARHGPAYGEAPPLYAINLSAAALEDADLVEAIRLWLEEYRVPAHMLCFEITETIALANLHRATNMIRELKNLGCLFALNHFGAGLSSFEQIKELPVDFLKIDGGFIKRIAEDCMHRAIVGAINRVAHVMAIQTVAECAESQSILDILKELGVDHAQGYAIQHPQPLEMLDTPSAQLPAQPANSKAAN